MMTGTKGTIGYPSQHRILSTTSVLIISIIFSQFNQLLIGQSLLILREVHGQILDCEFGLEEEKGGLFSLKNAYPRVASPLAM
jgi:hypothetical protein